MTLVIISFDVYGSRGKEQSTIRHEPSSSPRTHVFRPTRNSGVTRTCVHPADIADGAKELEVRGDVEDFWWQMTVCCVSVICLNHPTFECPILLEDSSVSCMSIIQFP
jgi:hypothetical protein